MPCSLLSFLFKLILLREFTIAAWSIYGTDKRASGSGDVRSSTPFSPHPDVWVSGCGHVFVSYRRGKSRDPQSVVFLNDEGGYIDIPGKKTCYDFVHVLIHLCSRRYTFLAKTSFRGLVGVPKRHNHEHWTLPEGQ